MVSLRNTLLGMTLATFALAVAAMATFGFAANAAASRLAYCGPSSVDAANAWCAHGATLMQAAMLEAAIAVALGLATLWLLRRRGERPRVAAHPA